MCTGVVNHTALCHQFESCSLNPSLLVPSGGVCLGDAVGRLSTRQGKLVSPSSSAVELNLSRCHHQVLLSATSLMLMAETPDFQALDFDEDQHLLVRLTTWQVCDHTLFFGVCRFSQALHRRDPSRQWTLSNCGGQTSKKNYHRR